MKSFVLLILPALLSSNSSQSIEKVLNRDEVYDMLMAKPIQEVKITNVNVTWENKVKDQVVQERLIKLGASNEFIGSHDVADQEKINTIRNSDDSKHLLYKGNLDAYFPKEAGEHKYTLKEFELTIEFNGDTSGKYTYVSYNGLVKSFTLSNNELTITDIFTYSYI